ncbi:hypothetical protein CO115_04145 [Candidatus Falkowbacteria bacterium CG_4_9_14_3_um_filter_36_9]|uniref:Uncharacterized protein n=1 Tax=Candidatus Falkowbacteria bacterium CG02_land_8_20_14_3_00_36_14 TaxID=1974560 RepID=A0A2M7DQB8_9BACT|nr:MAG: hypothetical protein COS18_01335 [Candidatus Falkowbacteria bacterium CG02_land_8_20_14_3_00_36_14]PIX11362.1 MAG: hypothetical protein COZ73_02815 [Candidatus Falkowbacteria bacterium CG_4_8_14_3_um_filter_36_11]PJA10821.1 MAG: hypothetical protein COX67_03070 [Candidatus Falkowbacteria bacterium CG_4_10_14_0_2_um_filter_36_22]PJB18595.1 MAG: hypothetical protein CO115_04145 [Candidatus Falkowbacteria bacterium CG_4_9_14_3_um_filter_36_9]
MDKKRDKEIKFKLFTKISNRHSINKNMAELIKQTNFYSEERALKEASKMQKKIESGEASDYNEDEKIIEKEKILGKIDFSEKQNREKFEELPQDKKRNLINTSFLVALEENERVKKDRQKKVENYRKYGKYAKHIYEIVVEIFQSKNMSSRAWRKKILRFHKLPAEAMFVFKKLKEENININEIPPDILKKILIRAFSLIDRKDDYDRDLAQKIGHFELLRWRNKEDLQNEDSFKKIVATLREHAVIKVTRTKAGQKPRVTFQPKGEYHKNENLL